ncbi:glycosyltransferase family 2 protein [Devosia sp.]|uniref:glycosyltransferase family 2 protein n=1 Tax=Devosia sp. TaxID=1871048 RepID=UPI003A935C20
MARVTVVTVYHNRRDHVLSSLQSLLDQDLQDLHILAVDDGSTDDTLAQLLRLAGPNLSVKSHANIGFTAAIRSALEGIDSEYVAIHGSGDLSAPDRLSHQLSYLEAHPKVGFCGTASETRDALTGDVVRRRRRHTGSLSANNFRRAPPFTHGSVMFRQSIYRQAGGYEARLRFCADWDLWFRMLHYAQGHFINVQLYQQLAQPDGASFHPLKSVEQLRYRALVLKLAELPDAAREARLEQLERESIVEATADQTPAIVAAIARRRVRLELMGRSADADQLTEVLTSEFGQDPPLLRLGASLSRLLNRRPMRSSDQRRPV